MRTEITGVVPGKHPFLGECFRSDTSAYSPDLKCPAAGLLNRRTQSYSAFLAQGCFKSLLSLKLKGLLLRVDS